MRKVFEEVEKHGAIITEFPMGTSPHLRIFRCATAWSRAWLWSGCGARGEYSGSLITSRLAMEFGREVYGVPGNVTEPVSFAPNPLIKQGAKLVAGWEDVVEELPTEIRAELFPVEATTQEESASLFQANLRASKLACIALVTSLALGSGEDNIRPQKGVSVYKQSLWHVH